MIVLVKLGEAAQAPYLVAVEAEDATKKLEAGTHRMATPQEQNLWARMQRASHQLIEATNAHMREIG